MSSDTNATKSKRRRKGPAWVRLGPANLDSEAMGSSSPQGLLIIRSILTHPPLADFCQYYVITRRLLPRLGGRAASTVAVPSGFVWFHLACMHKDEIATVLFIRAIHTDPCCAHAWICVYIYVCVCVCICIMLVYKRMHIYVFSQPFLNCWNSCLFVFVYESRD